MEYDFTQFYPIFHGKDIPGAKFKLGEEIKINPLPTFRNPEIPINHEKHIVTGVGLSEEDIYEYSVTNFPYLLWEDEMEKI